MGTEIHILLKEEHHSKSSKPLVGNLHQDYRNSNPDYTKYIEKHGYHFSDKLAEWAISRMENSSGPHVWSVKQVDSVVNSLHPNRVFKHKVTTGDLAYQANMYYADLFPEGIVTEQACVKSAILIANDPDGYEGQIFCRWLTDTMMKSLEVDWIEFI